jgi:excisionase family DNA binding protein
MMQINQRIDSASNKRIDPFESLKTATGGQQNRRMNHSEGENYAPEAKARGNPAFLSRREVSSLFGVSVSTVTRWARQGLLKTVRTPGGHYRFPAEETRQAAFDAGASGKTPGN